jgi:hypothetical protein
VVKVLYYNNCWFTNVGEAFIDIGAMELIKQTFNDVKIANISDMSNYYAPRVALKTESLKSKLLRKILCLKPKDLDHYQNLSIYDMGRDFYADYVVLAGMFATKDFLVSPGYKMIKNLVDEGSKLILLGIGGLDYSEDEITSFRKFLYETNPVILTTRDRNTYEAYKDYAPCVSAIDCAFWVKDVFDPRGFSKHDYDVVSFCRIKEPIEFKSYSHLIVRPYHFQYDFNIKSFRKELLLSDTPFDYLTVYANAKRVFTDLVHGAIISLEFGVPVKYYDKSKRANAFYAIDSLKETDDGFIELDEGDLILKKESRRSLTFTTRTSGGSGASSSSCVK